MIARNDITEGEIVSVEPVPLLMLLFDPQEAKWSRFSKKYYLKICCKRKYYVKFHTMYDAAKTVAKTVA